MCSNPGIYNLGASRWIETRSGCLLGRCVMRSKSKCVILFVYIHHASFSDKKKKKAMRMVHSIKRCTCIRFTRRINYTKLHTHTHIYACMGKSRLKNRFGTKRSVWFPELAGISLPSTFVAEVPLSKAPNPQVLPRHCGMWLPTAPGKCA